MRINIIKNRISVIGSSDLAKISFAEKYQNDVFYTNTKAITRNEINKKPYRFDIINFLAEKFNRSVKYLEIGVRNRNENFDFVKADEKYGVDPGYESEINDVDFKMTSDEFFSELEKDKILNKAIKFDIIFIDGLHLAEQVERDIENSLKHLAEDGFIVLHDCNPPTEFHASENYEFQLSPSGGAWNGTTWKAFVKTRKRNDIFSCCIDTDWGVGIISKKINLGPVNLIPNEFYEYKILDKFRKDSLNLISFDDFKSLF